MLFNKIIDFVAWSPLRRRHPPWPPSPLSPPSSSLSSFFAFAGSRPSLIPLPLFPHRRLLSRSKTRAPDGGRYLAAVRKQIVRFRLFAAARMKISRRISPRENKAGLGAALGINARRVLVPSPVSSRLRRPPDLSLL